MTGGMTIYICAESTSMEMCMHTGVGTMRAPPIPTQGGPHTRIFSPTSTPLQDFPSEEKGSPTRVFLTYIDTFQDFHPRRKGKPTKTPPKKGRRIARALTFSPHTHV